MTQLYVPRDNISLKEVKGEVHANGQLPDILSKPLRIYKTGNIPALNSGYRSALVYDNGNMYRIKACKPMRRPRLKDLPEEPLGGQILSRVESEIENMIVYKEIFEQEGIPYPCLPLGYYKYGLEYNGEPMAATLFKIEGDTRLDELVAFLESEVMNENGAVPELFDLLDKLAYKAGRIKRMTDDRGYVLGLANSHSGNFVVFEMDGEIHLGNVDLDSAYKPEFIDLSAEDTKHLQGREQDRIIDSFYSPEIMSGQRFRVRLSRRGNNIEADHRTALIGGFKRGYYYAKDEVSKITPDEISYVKEMAKPENVDEGVRYRVFDIVVRLNLEKMIKTAVEGIEADFGIEDETAETS